MIDELITRAVAGALEELRPQIAQAVERRLANELAGTQAYFRKPKPSADEIASRFNGRNAAEVARAMGVSRRTVERAVKQVRSKRISTAT
jgi:Mor family transcriptional regulator